MAKALSSGSNKVEHKPKGTSIGRGHFNTSSMNKRRKQTTKNIEGKVSNIMAKYGKFDPKNKKRTKDKYRSEKKSTRQVENQSFTRSYVKSKISEKYNASV